MRDRIRLTILLLFLAALTRLAGEDASPICPTYFERFSKAEELAKYGKAKEAFWAFGEVFAPLKNPKEKPAMTDQFVFEVNLRRVACLLEMEDFERAARLCEATAAVRLLTRVDYNQRYSYWFQYGNSLGKLKRLPEMKNAFQEAIAQWKGRVGDEEKIEPAWRCILEFGEQAQDWEFLEKAGEEAFKLGGLSDIPTLQIRAVENLCLAYRGLKKYQKAREQAQVLIDLFSKGTDSAEMLLRWQRFLETLPTE